LLTISFLISSAVRLAYESIDATTDGENLPPLVILHGLFGSKQNWRTLAKLFQRETGRQVLPSHAFLLHFSGLFTCDVLPL